MTTDELAALIDAQIATLMDLHEVRSPEEFEAELRTALVGLATIVQTGPKGNMQANLQALAAGYRDAAAEVRAERDALAAEVAELKSHKAKGWMSREGFNGVHATGYEAAERDVEAWLRSDGLGEVWLADQITAGAHRTKGPAGG